MKQILILSMTCGEGHNSVAESIKSELEKNDASVQIVQIYGYDEREVIRQNNLFLFASKRFPRIYDAIWNAQRKRNPQDRYKGGIQPSIVKPTKYVKEQILLHKPHMIICVHFYAGAIVNNLKRDNWLDPSIQTYTILTDYCVHPFWETNYLLDTVFTPAEYLSEELEHKGFTPNQIVCTGFPINQKFLNPISKTDARKMFDIPNESFVSLIVSGGYCLANPIPILKELKDNPNLHLIVVCGKNKKRYAQTKRYIQKHNMKNVTLLGFTKQIPELMAASDCLISRGGANFITEALHSELPIVFREKCIINERLNAQMLTEQGCALLLENASQITEKIEYLMQENHMETMKQNIRNIKKPNALQEMCNYILRKGMRDDKKN